MRPGEASDPEGSDDPRGSAAAQAADRVGPTATRPVAPERDPALTLPAERLKGSPRCLNCGTPLQGPFCHYCGQPDRNLVRFFPVLLRELLEDFAEFDSRFMRTLRPLLFRPGRLTRDYLDGRRFRYTPPLRLYIFTSMIFFILAATLAGDALNFAADDNDGGITISLDTEAETRIGEEIDRAVADGDLTPAEAERATAAIGQALSAVEGQGPDAGDHSHDPDDEHPIVINGERWDRETNPIELSGVPDFVNDWINDEIEQSPQKGHEIEANPNLMVEQVFEVLPVAVFVMLPAVALLFKFWYLFARRYYIEHLIHALHNHAFLFVVFTLTLVADSLATWLDPAGTGRIAQAAEAITIALMCWIPVYLLISLKTVYRQGWPLTIAKFSVIGISYLALLALVTVAVALLSFVLL